MGTHEGGFPSPLGGILQKALTEVMLVTVEVPGSRDRARPMQVAQLDDDASLWFIAPLDGACPHEPQHGSVTTRIGTRWLQMTGRFEVLADRDQLRALRVANDDRHHTTPADEETAVLLHFVPDSAELWDTTAPGGMRQPIEAAHGCGGAAA